MCPRGRPRSQGRPQGLHFWDLHGVGPLALWNFRNIFLPNTVKHQRKSYMSAEPLALRHMLNPSLVIALGS